MRAMTANRMRRAFDTADRIHARTGLSLEVLYAALLGGLSVYVDDETWDEQLAGLDSDYRPLLETVDDEATA